MSRNVPHRYSLELPETDASLKMQRASLSKTVYLVQDKDAPEPQCLVIVDGKIVDLPTFSGSMEDWRLCHNEADIPLLTCCLNIDKKVKMRDVDEVLQALADIRFYRIQYAVVPRHRELDVRYYNFLALNAMRLPIRFYGDSIYQQWVEGVGEIPNQIMVTSLGAETYNVNGTLVEGTECKTIIKDLIRQDLNYIIRFKVDDEMLYGEYITVMASVMEALNDLKEECAMERYMKHWTQLSPDEEEEVYYRFPFRFFEEK